MVKLIKHTGARYSQITSKHRDGVDLCDMKMNKLSALQTTSAKRELLTPFVNELRKNGIKTGLYYSLMEALVENYCFQIN